MFENFKGQNNAETSFDADVSASSTIWSIKPGEGNLFQINGSFEFPFLLTGEKFNDSGQVIGREIVKVTGSPATDQFIVERQYEECIQNETIDPKVISNGPQTFSSGDKISLYQTAGDNRDLKNELIRINDDLTTNYATKDEVKKGELNYYESTNDTDSYEITIPGITSYTDGLEIKVKADVANTGACTLDINGLGAKSVKKQQGTVDLIDGDWGANGIGTLVYNSALDVFQFDGQNVVLPDLGLSVLEKLQLIFHYFPFTPTGFIVEYLITIQSVAIGGSKKGMAMKPDGTTFFTSTANGTIEQRNLSTAFDLSTSSSFDTFNAGFSVIFPDLKLNSTGTKLFFLYVFPGVATYLQEINLSTPYDLTTANNFNQNDRTEADLEENDGTCFDFNGDFSELFVAGEQNKTIYKYNLPVSGDIDNGTYSGDSLNLSTLFSISTSINPEGIKFIENGNALIVKMSNNNFYRVELSTPYDITTASYNGDLKNISLPGNISGIDIISGDDRIFTGSQASGYTHKLQVIAPTFNRIEDTQSQSKLGKMIQVGDTITVSGTTSNNGIKTVSKIVDNNNIYISESVTDETIQSKIEHNVQNGDTIERFNGGNVWR